MRDEARADHRARAVVEPTDRRRACAAGFPVHHGTDDADRDGSRAGTWEAAYHARANELLASYRGTTLPISLKEGGTRRDLEHLAITPRLYNGFVDAPRSRTSQRHRHAGRCGADRFSALPGPSATGRPGCVDRPSTPTTITSRIGHSAMV